MEARGPARMTQFSQWETTYDHDNEVTEEAKKNTLFKPATIDDHFKPRYHRYHTEYYQERIKDPYFSINKTNHLLNFNVRIPDYMGYIPKSVDNIKGNARPFCLTPKGETFH